MKIKRFLTSSLNNIAVCRMSLFVRLGLDKLILVKFVGGGCLFAFELNNKPKLVVWN